MAALTSLLDQLPWNLVIIACLTLGLAPFVPEPHIWEKLKMLAGGTLTRPIDIFDLLMHAAPFIVAGLKLLLGTRGGV
ncbi:MAG: RND transporter [Nitratireductor sp.]|nr:RND transporter [Nitratireductor sp.]